MKRNWINFVSFIVFFSNLISGVVKELRKQGIASFLLENLIAHLTTGENHEVKAVYLHVLTTNNAAITFYEHRGFRPHLFLPYYYAIGKLYYKYIFEWIR